MADKSVVTLGQLGIVKGYIDGKDALNIKSAEFADDTIKFYTTVDKSGEPAAEIVLPEETFLDVSKTEFVDNFSWNAAKYPKSTDPGLDGRKVLVLAVKNGRKTGFSFVPIDLAAFDLGGSDTDTFEVSAADGALAANVKISADDGNAIVVKNDGLFVGIPEQEKIKLEIATADEINELFAVDDMGSVMTLANMNVGDIVKINEDGVPTNFIIVHKGNPDPEMYDASCDGVWLLREKLDSSMAMEWDSENNDYENSDVHAYLNTDYINKFDTKTRSIIKNVKIPYFKGTSKNRIGVQIGENGLNCKTFLLSPREIGLAKTNSLYPKDGSLLEIGVTTSKSRICYNENGKACQWHLRSLNLYYTDKETTHCMVLIDGDFGSGNISTAKNVRPAFILPYNVPVGDDGAIVC